MNFVFCAVAINLLFLALPANGEWVTSPYSSALGESDDQVTFSQSHREDDIFETNVSDRNGIRFEHWFDKEFFIPKLSSVSSFGVGVGVGFDIAKLAVNTEPRTLRITESYCSLYSQLFGCVRYGFTTIDSFLYEVDREMLYFTINLLWRYQYAKSEQFPKGKGQFYVMMSPAGLGGTYDKVTVCIDSSCSSYRDTSLIHTLSLGMKFFLNNNLSLFLEQNMTTYHFMNKMSSTVGGERKFELSAQSIFAGISYHY